MYWLSLNYPMKFSLTSAIKKEYKNIYGSTSPILDIFLYIINIIRKFLEGSISKVNVRDFTSRSISIRLMIENHTKCHLER